MAFCSGLPSGNPEIAKVGTPVILWDDTSSTDLRSGWGLKRSCSPRQELSNGASHATCMQRNWVDSQLFMVESQTISLTPCLSFGHKLCFRCPNGSCEHILDIYVSIVFQWYKDIFKARDFDPCNCSLKIWESTGTTTPNMGIHLGVWVFILTLSHTPRSFFWPDLLQNLALVTSLRLGLRHIYIPLVHSSWGAIEINCGKWLFKGLNNRPWQTILMIMQEERSRVICRQDGVIGRRRLASPSRETNIMF
jgi:hypothetical protein